MIAVERKGPFITETDLQFTKRFLGLVNVKKISRKIIKMKVLTDIKLNSFERKLKNTLSYASVGGQGFFSCIGNQWDITISLIAMETTTNTGKTQKFNRKVREESVEAI